MLFLMVVVFEFFAAKCYFSIDPVNGVNSLISVFSLARLWIMSIIFDVCVFRPTASDNLMYLFRDLVKVVRLLFIEVSNGWMEANYPILL